MTPDPITDQNKLNPIPHQQFRSLFKKTRSKQDRLDPEYQKQSSSLE